MCCHAPSQPERRRPTGTARRRADEQLCPVDATGRLRGVRRVGCHASILRPEVNPQRRGPADQTVGVIA